MTIYALVSVDETGIQRTFIASSRRGLLLKVSVQFAGEIKDWRDLNQPEYAVLAGKEHSALLEMLSRHKDWKTPGRYELENIYPHRDRWTLIVGT